MNKLLDAIRDHASDIARQAGELAEHVAEVDEARVLALPLAVGLVDLERVRSDLSRAADALLAHVEPRHAPPAMDR